MRSQALFLLAPFALAAKPVARQHSGLSTKFGHVKLTDDLGYCDAGDEVCENGCMPEGSTCCNDNTDEYCDAGYYCVPYACCREGETCDSSDYFGYDTTTSLSPWTWASTSTQATRTPFATSAATTTTTDDAIFPTATSGNDEDSSSGASSGSSSGSSSGITDDIGSDDSSDDSSDSATTTTAGSSPEPTVGMAGHFAADSKVAAGLALAAALLV
ncbi:hypothetical protein F4780DRAFT_134914 [Xylariomycetidae sp. FL0641]|nr:hypothetical protein F4780DRAFT_134914 [Xylariomycetidae sp. FL0641]